jgi:enoyl-CoA hydratase/carnithine racemase
MAVASKPRTDAGAAIVFLQAINTFCKPIVAAVDGPAVGIGTTLLLHCDAVVMGETAYLHMPFVDLGVCAEGASTLLLAKYVGARRAMSWLMGEKVTAQAALAANFVNQVVPSGQAEAAAMILAQQWAKKSLASVKATKALLRRHDATATQDTFMLESLQFGMLLDTPETQAKFAQFFAAKK